MNLLLNVLGDFRCPIIESFPELCSPRLPTYLRQVFEKNLEHSPTKDYTLYRVQGEKS